MPSPRELIEAIQRDRGFDPAGRGPVGAPRGRNQRDLGNALKLLSEQLYNSDGHFVLELLQNADDNRYPPGDEPTVVIEIGESGIVVQNNEVGFNDANVEALCSVGESTKRGQKALATGEKGIGFKAVFKVSDCPEVHSGAFHFWLPSRKCPMTERPENKVRIEYLGYPARAAKLETRRPRTDAHGDVCSENPPSTDLALRLPVRG